MTERRRVRLDKQGEPVMPTFGPEESVEPETCNCSYLDREEWDRIENDWTDIAFVRKATNALLGVPVGFANAKAELKETAARLGLTVPEDAMLLLGAGKFRRSIMLEVEGAMAGLKAIYHPGGLAYTRLRAAPWGEMRHVVDETVTEARDRYGRDPDDLFVWYLTCRTCSRERNFETLFVAHYKPAK